MYMKETLKFINLMTYPLDQADKDILKWESEKSMDDLYQNLNKWRPWWFFDSAAKAQEYNDKSQIMKAVIQKMKHTHTSFQWYFEVISDTDKENVKKITIVVSKNGCKEQYSEAKLFLLKDKLQKAYDLYNQVIFKWEYNQPFLEWDGEILFDDKKIKADIALGKTSDTADKETWVDLNITSKLIDIAIRKIETKCL